MEKKNWFQIKMIIPIVIAVVWLVIFLLYQNNPNIGTDYWIAFVFGLIGIAAVELSMYLKVRGNGSTLEIGAVSIIYAAVFTIISLVLNLFFAFMPKHELAPVFVIVNLIVLLMYGILVYYSNKSLKRVNELTEYSADRMGDVTNISRLLATLMSITVDETVKQELRKLKEKVDYSNNVFQNFSKELEDTFLQKIQEIQDDIADGVENDIVVSKIKDASATWSARNSHVNSIK